MGQQMEPYHPYCKTKDNKGIIFFPHAWSIPRRIITAFANKFQISFQYKYLDEMGNFWGVEYWNDKQRSIRRYMDKSDLKLLQDEFLD